MVAMIGSLIIAVIIAGFLYWIWTLVRPLLAGFIGDPFMRIIDILVLVLVGAIVVFWVVIPIITALTHATGPALLR